MSLKHGMLGLLSYEPLTGYELDKLFKESLAFFWSAKASQMYKELNDMEKNGWLVSEHIIQTDRPNKRLYTITQQGRDELTRWLTDIPSPSNIKSRNGFLMRIFFGSEVDKSHTLKLLNDLKKELTTISDHFHTVLEEDHAANDENFKLQAKYWGLTVLYGEMAYKMQLDWLEKAIKILEED